MFRNNGRKTPATKPSWLLKFQFAGDSITSDSNWGANRSGFRQPFVQTIYEVYGYLMNAFTDIVGQQNSNNTRTSVPFCGTSGLRSDQLLATYVGTGSGDALNAATLAPSMVHLNIGTNDLLQNYNSSRTAPHTHVTTTIGQIIDAYKTANPSVKVIVANLFDNNAQAAAFLSCKASIKSYIEGRADFGVNSFVFDSFTAMGAYTLTNWDDDTHLNNAGNVIYNTAHVARLRALFEV